jgi:hypothetical protein
VIDFTTDILRLLQPGWDAHNEREDMGRHLAESAGVDLVPTSSTPPRAPSTPEVWALHRAAVRAGARHHTPHQGWIPATAPRV